jgi:hypothetical protein
MIVERRITSGLELKSDKGSELYIEVDHSQGKAKVHYWHKDGERINLDAGSLEDLVEMLTEALKEIKAQGKLG